MIQEGYQDWINDPARKQSAELDFGCWWVLYPNEPPATPMWATIADQPVAILAAGTYHRWRVSWIDDTGELYATQLGADFFIVLGHFETKAQVEKRMEGWAHNIPHALVDFFHLFLCERYKAELVRLHGQKCADASVVELAADGHYLVAVATEYSGQFVLDEKPQSHTLDVMQQMLEELKKRKPPLPRSATASYLYPFRSQPAATLAL